MTGRAGPPSGLSVKRYTSGVLALEVPWPAVRDLTAIDPGWAAPDDRSEVSVAGAIKVAPKPHHQLGPPLRRPSAT